MIPDAWRDGEIAVLGLGRTGAAVAKFLAGRQYAVYVSELKDSAEVRAAADLANRQGVDVDVGRHDLDRIAKAALVITSPGIPPNAAPLKAAHDANVTVLSELDIALLFLPGVPSIAVSGTNGKSTTTALVAHLLKEAGVAAVAAGNIGYPLIEIAAKEQRPDWLVVEVSSFQLHYSPHLAPDIGILTNISPDHVDWHGTVEAYYADKRRLFENATKSSVWVVNGDDPAVLELAAGVPGRLRTWSLESRADAWYDRVAEELNLDSEMSIPRIRVPLLGDHNVANVLAAGLAASAAGIERDALISGIESFKALSHRLEPIREVDGVLWINDSKATNVSSTEVAIRAMTRPFVLMLGGRGKGEPYSKLATVAEECCRAVIAYGEDRERIAGDLGAVLPLHLEAGFEAAMARARALAVGGDVVLLSPACASFDEFSNFEQRGNTFREIVEGL